MNNLSNDRNLLTGLIAVQFFMFASLLFNPKIQDDYYNLFKDKVSKETSDAKINRYKMASHFFYTASLGALRYILMQPYSEIINLSWTSSYGFYLDCIFIGVTTDTVYFKQKSVNLAVFLVGSLMKIIAQLDESKEDKLNVSFPIKAEAGLSFLGLLLIIKACWVVCRRKKPKPVTNTEALLIEPATVATSPIDIEPFNRVHYRRYLMVPTLLISLSCGLYTSRCLYYEKNNMWQNFKIFGIASLSMFFDAIFIPMKMYLTKKNKHLPSRNWENIFVTEFMCILLSFIATFGVSLIGNMNNKSNGDWLRITALACEGNALLLIMILERNRCTTEITKGLYIIIEMVFKGFYMILEMTAKGCHMITETGNTYKKKLTAAKILLPPVADEENGCATSTRHSPNNVVLGPCSLNSAQDTQRPHPETQPTMTNYY